MHGAQNKDLFSTCVSDLVMESREFEMVLGKVQPDGSVKPGCVDKFQTDTSQVISFVAEEAEEKGLYEDAIRLYDLAKVHIVQDLMCPCHVQVVMVIVIFYPFLVNPLCMYER